MKRLLFAFALLLLAIIGPAGAQMVPGISNSMVLVCNAPPRTLFSLSLSGNTASYAGYTLRQIIPASAMTQSVCTGHSSVSSTSGNTSAVIVTQYVCNQGGAQNYSCAAAPVQVTFGGAAGWTVPSNTTVVSDSVPFVWDGSSNVVVSTYISSGTFEYLTVANYYPWYLFGSDASNQTPTGYTQAASGYSYFISAITSQR